MSSLSKLACLLVAWTGIGFLVATSPDSLFERMLENHPHAAQFQAAARISPIRASAVITDQTQYQVVLTRRFADTVKPIQRQSILRTLSAREVLIEHALGHRRTTSALAKLKYADLLKRHAGDRLIVVTDTVTEGLVDRFTFVDDGNVAGCRASIPTNRVTRGTFEMVDELTIRKLYVAALRLEAELRLRNGETEESLRFLHEANQIGFDSVDLFVMLYQCFLNLERVHEAQRTRRLLLHQFAAQITAEQCGELALAAKEKGLDSEVAHWRNEQQLRRGSRLTLDSLLAGVSDLPAVSEYSRRPWSEVDTEFRWILDLHTKLANEGGALLLRRKGKDYLIAVGVVSMRGNASSDSIRRELVSRAKAFRAASEYLNGLAITRESTLRATSRSDVDMDWEEYETFDESILARSKGVLPGLRTLGDWSSADGERFFQAFGATLEN